MPKTVDWKNWISVAVFGVLFTMALAAFIREASRQTDPRPLMMFLAGVWALAMLIVVIQRVARAEIRNSKSP